MNIPRSLNQLLSEAGYTARHVADIGLATALDANIVAEARKHSEIILTHDLDYGRLLSFEGAKDPSVIIFRVHSSLPSRLFILLTTALPQIEQSLNKGAIIVIEEGILRVRCLPIELEESS